MEQSYNLFFMQIHSNLPNSFINFLTSKSKHIVSQQNDLNQLSYDFMDSNLIVRTTKKAQRGKNFSPEEYCLLVSAWLNTSKDPITGTNKTILGSSTCVLCREWRKLK